MLQHTKVCVQPVLDYFEKHLSSSLTDALMACKAARFFLCRRFAIFSQMLMQLMP